MGFQFQEQTLYQFSNFKLIDPSKSFFDKNNSADVGNVHRKYASGLCMWGRHMQICIAVLVNVLKIIKKYKKLRKVTQKIKNETNQISKN